MTSILGTSVWPGLAIWVVLYMSDYYLTIACARLYRAQDKIVIEGSFELTPAFQADVNALKRVSFRFFLALLTSVISLFLIYRLSLTPYVWPEIFPFFLGMLILAEIAVHVRHLRNWYLFSRAMGPGGLRGRLEYPRTIALRVSALELWSFAALYGVLFLFTGSWFVLGGAFSCAITAWKHRGLARAHARSSAAAAA